MRASNAGKRPSLSSSRRLLMQLVVTQGGELLGLMLGSEGGNQLFQVTFHDVGQLVKRQVDAVIGHPPLGIVIRANAFGAISRTDQALALRRFFSLDFLLLLIFQACREHLHGLLAVTVLGTIVLTFHHHTGRQVSNTYGGIRLVDVLTTGTTGAEGINSKI